MEGTVSRWLVKEGDRVERDQPLVEVTTDKVDAEIPSPVAGVVEALLAAEGEVVAVGAALARIADGGAHGGGAQRPANAPRRPRRPRAAARRRPQPTAPARRARSAARDAASRAASPRRRRSTCAPIEPTGAGGKVTKRDVEAHLRGAREPRRLRRARRRRRRARAAGAPARPISSTRSRTATA